MMREGVGDRKRRVFYCAVHMKLDSAGQIKWKNRNGRIQGD